MKKNDCPEFPYFGASYPDARCIDGYLWDLDKYTEDGGLYGGGDDPCPFCNTEEFIKHHHDPLNRVTKKLLLEVIENMKKKYL